MNTNLIYFKVLFFFGLASSLWSWPMESGERARDAHATSTEQRTNQRRRASDQPQEADANATIEKWNNIINQPQHWLDEKENLTQEAKEDFTFWNEKARALSTQSQQENLEPREKEKFESLAQGSAQAAQRAEEFLQLLEIQEGFIERINNPPELFRVSYEQADQARKERNEAWEKEYAHYQDQQKSETEVAVRAEQLQQSHQANERQQQNFIAQIANTAGNAGGVLTGFPEPLIATGGAVVATTGGFLGTMNQIVGLFRISAAQVFHDECQRIHQEHRDNLNASLENILTCSKKVIELEEPILQQERVSNMTFAEKLKPQSHWEQDDWKFWHRDMNFSWPEASIKKLQENIIRTQKMMALAWKEKIKNLKKDFTALDQERTEALSMLNGSYKEAERRVQEIKDQESQLRDQLKIEEQEKTNLQENAKSLIAEIEILRANNQKLLPAKQEELTKTREQQQLLTQKIFRTKAHLNNASDKKVYEENNLGMASLACYHFEEHRSPAHQLYRLKTRLEAAQEALEKNFPNEVVRTLQMHFEKIKKPIEEIEKEIGKMWHPNSWTADFLRRLLKYPTYESLLNQLVPMIERTLAGTRELTETASRIQSADQSIDVSNVIHASLWAEELHSHWKKELDRLWHYQGGNEEFTESDDTIRPRRDTDYLKNKKDFEEKETKRRDLAKLQSNLKTCLEDEKMHLELYAKANKELSKDEQEIRQGDERAKNLVQNLANMEAGTVSVVSNHHQDTIFTKDDLKKNDQLLQNAEQNENSFSAAAKNLQALDPTTPNPNKITDEYLDNAKKSTSQQRAEALAQQQAMQAGRSSAEKELQQKISERTWKEYLWSGSPAVAAAENKVQSYETSEKFHGREAGKHAKKIDQIDETTAALKNKKATETKLDSYQEGLLSPYGKDVLDSAAKIQKISEEHNLSEDRQILQQVAEDKSPGLTQKDCDRDANQAKEVMDEYGSVSNTQYSDVLKWFQNLSTSSSQKN